MNTFENNESVGIWSKCIFSHYKEGHKILLIANEICKIWLCISFWSLELEILYKSLFQIYFIFFYYWSFAFLEKFDYSFPYKNAEFVIKMR